MLIAGFPAGAWGTNCYLVAPACEECVIIDPGHQAAQGVEEALRKHRLKPVAVVLTHGHIDHVASVVPVCGAHDVPAWIHPEDRYMMSDPEKALGRSIGMPLMGELTVGEPDDVKELTDGSKLTLAGLEFGVSHAPGHTKGSVTFGMPEAGDVPPVLFSGDLLFALLRRTHRPARRRPRRVAGVAGPCVPAARRLDRGAVRPRPPDDHRPRARRQSVSERLGRGAAPRTVDERRIHVSTFQAPKGTYDLTPPRSATFLAVREAISAPLRDSGYGYIETPGFENVELFARGVGESTDIVTKEMYTLTTKGGDQLALRPEGTASVLRAALEANLHKAGNLPVKLWYSGSYYRYERPQAGRYRHFSQVGAEAIGTEDPALDAELIILADQAYRSLGLRRFRILLNSLGDKECRPVYREALQTFLRDLDLDEETRRRIEINPLRVLDDKRADVQKQLTDAPKLRDYLCDACKAYHEEVRALLTAAGVAFEDDEKLVRGLDYYTRTTFEFVHDGLGSQSAVGGGGRYDGLSEMIGGPELPSVGWALGVDRTVLALEAESVELDLPATTSVYAVPLGEEARRVLFGVVTELRRAGIAADFAFGGRGLKGAMKSANRSGARYTLVAGERDLAEGVVQLKDMESGEQSAVPLAEAAAELAKRLG